MFRLNGWTISIGAVSVVVGLVVALGVGAAQGSVLPVAPPHGPPPPPICEHFVYDGVTQPTVPGCVELAPSPDWSPPVGAVGPGGHVVTAADQIDGPAVRCSTVCGWAMYTLHGKPLTSKTVDWLRAPDGQVRLFSPDIEEVETGVPSPAEIAAAAKLGVTPVPGEIDMTPAPLARFPITPNDNSLGWTKATGP